MKYGSFLPLFTSSQADITLFVNGRGPHENTPILETYMKGEGGISFAFESPLWGIHLYMTYIGMLLLYEFQKTRHIRTTEMIDSLQSSEHRSFRQSLKVIFTNILQGKREIEN